MELGETLTIWLGNPNHPACFALTPCRCTGQHGSMAGNGQMVPLLRGLSRTCFTSPIGPTCMSELHTVYRTSPPRAASCPGWISAGLSFARLRIRGTNICTDPTASNGPNQRREAANSTSPSARARTQAASQVAAGAGRAAAAELLRERAHRRAVPQVWCPAFRNVPLAVPERVPEPGVHVVARTRLGLCAKTNSRSVLPSKIMAISTLRSGTVPGDTELDPAGRQLPGTCRLQSGPPPEDARPRTYP